MISFLLLLMAAAACCAPNSHQGSQSNGCALLPEITQTIYDSWTKKYSDLPPGYEVTKANYTVGKKFPYSKITCSYKHNWLVFNTAAGTLYSTDVIECDDGEWIAKNIGFGPETYRPTAVACARPPTDKPTKCATSLGEVMLSELETRTTPRMGYYFELTKANFTDKEVTCSESTLFIAVKTADDKEVGITDSIKCNDGQWIAEDSTTGKVYRPTRSSCVSEKKKCATVNNYTQYDYWYRGGDRLTIQLEITPANITNDKITCSDSSTYILYFKRLDGYSMKELFGVNELVCVDGVWMGRDGMQLKYQPAELACARQKCALLPEIMQAVYDSGTKKYAGLPPGYEVTKAKFTVGEKFPYSKVTCSDETQLLVFNTAAGTLYSTDVIECDDWEWIAKNQYYPEMFSSNRFRPTEVACARPPTNKPKKVDEDE